jgi:hypothetical protein
VSDWVRFEGSLGVRHRRRPLPDRREHLCADRAQDRRPENRAFALAQDRHRPPVHVRLDLAPQLRPRSSPGEADLGEIDTRIIVRREVLTHLEGNTFGHGASEIAERVPESEAHETCAGVFVVVRGHRSRQIRLIQQTLRTRRRLCASRSSSMYGFPSVSRNQR